MGGTPPDFHCHMMLRQANRLEAAGKLLDAFRINVDLVGSHGRYSPMGRQALGNARRILPRLQGEAQAQARVLVACFPEFAATAPPVITSATAPRPQQETTPLVTVVTPCYNALELLPATVASIKAQNWPRFEVVLVDDFSSDGTADYCKSLTKRDKRFRFYQHRAHGGLPVARNSGLRLARGDFVCFLDSDDLLAPTSLANRAILLQQHRNDAWVLGVFDQSITIPYDFAGQIPDSRTKLTRDYVDFVNVFGDCPFNANQPLLKRAALVELGGFPENYPQAEDWRFWSKALRAGYVFLPLASIGSGYRQTPNSMIRRAPLVHLGKSLTTLLRSHREWQAERHPAERRYEERAFARPLFTQAVGLYETRHRFVMRLLNFSGIDYARQLDTAGALSLDALERTMHDIEPELPLVFTGYTLANAVAWFENGVRRYRGVDKLPPADKKAVATCVARLLSRLGVLNQALEVGPAKRLIPPRNLIRQPPEVLDIAFFPHKAYHTHSFRLLLPLLETAGLRYCFVDITVPYRDEQARVPELAAQMLSYNEFVLSRIQPRMIVCMNDWDTVVKPVIKKANACGMPTVGIVEGVQDYLDVDTGRKRHPYREVGHVFLPGPFDRRYFTGSDQHLYDIGVQRLDGLDAHRQARAATARGTPRTAVLNVNFSYGVMTERRARWVADVAAACEQAGYRLLISQHPQDDADLSAYAVDPRPLYTLLAEADVFISRFSGAILRVAGHRLPGDLLQRPRRAHRQVPGWNGGLRGRQRRCYAGDHASRRPTWRRGRRPLPARPRRPGPTPRQIGGRGHCRRANSDSAHPASTTREVARIQDVSPFLTFSLHTRGIRSRAMSDIVKEGKSSLTEEALNLEFNREHWTKPENWFGKDRFGYQWGGCRQKNGEVAYITDLHLRPSLPHRYDLKILGLSRGGGRFNVELFRYADSYWFLEWYTCTATSCADTCTSLPNAWRLLGSSSSTTPEKAPSRPAAALTFTRKTSRRGRPKSGWLSSTRAHATTRVTTLAFCDGILACSPAPRAPTVLPVGCLKTNLRAYSSGHLQESALRLG